MHVYELEFNYAFLDEIDKILLTSKIKKKTFMKNIVIYHCLFNETDEKYLLSELKKVTNNLIKIKKVEYTIDDYQVGTDKPLGSKSAIDEN